MRNNINNKDSKNVVKNNRYSSFDEGDNSRSDESHCVLSLNDSSINNMNISDALHPEMESQITNIIKDHQDAIIEKNHWVPDAKAKLCLKCEKEFTFFNRKHHCRFCGNVFCNNCTNVKHLSQSKFIEFLRVCDGRFEKHCEQMMEYYNQSLISKNNLIKTNHQQSPREEIKSQSSSSQIEEDENNDKVGSLVANKKKVTKIKSFENPLDAENQRLLIEQEEEQKQLNDFKLQSEFLKEEDKDDENIEKYSQYVQQVEMLEEELESSRKESIDSERKFNDAKLKEFANQHIQNIVKDLVVQHNIDSDKWESKLLSFVRTAVWNIRPSSQLLNDQMNFNSYVKIKIINWLDNSKSDYINGVVMSNNLADKRMLTAIETPRILILKDSLGFVRDEGALLNIGSIIDQEEYQKNILLQKLNQVKPKIIIVEKDISCKILDLLRERNSGENEDKITVINNLSLDKIKRIARYTQTIICPSTNVINPKFKLGHCKNFRVEKTYVMNHKLVERIQREKTINLQGIVSKQKDLIYFEGCNPALGCTILLSGDFYFELEEMKNVKLALREMLYIARNVTLERGFLSQMCCQIPRKLQSEGGAPIYESPFLITRYVNNRSTIVLSKVIIKKGSANFSVQDKIQNLNITASNQQALMNQTGFGGMMDQDRSVAYHNRFEDSQNIVISPPNANVTQLAANTPVPNKINENFVKTKIDSMCGCPIKEKITFYKENDEEKNNDKTLGKFLTKLCKKAARPCEHCKDPMYKHLIQYYHKDGYIEIQVDLYQPLDGKQNKKSQQNFTQIKNQLGTTEILRSRECKVCKVQIFPETPISSELYEYSTARYFEQFFYNGDKLLTMECGHRALRDVARKFIVNRGIVITISYILNEVYSIELLRPDKHDTRDVYNRFINDSKKRMEQAVKMAQEDFKKKIQNVEAAIVTSICDVIPQENKDTIFQGTNIIWFLQQLEQLTNRLKLTENEVQLLVFQAEAAIKDIKEFDLLVPLEQMDDQNTFDKMHMQAALFLERKLLVNFLTFSKVIDEILMMACILLVIIKRRVDIIKQQVETSNPHNDSMEDFHKNLQLNQESLDTSKTNQKENSMMDRLSFAQFQNLRKNSTLNLPLIEANESASHYSHQFEIIQQMQMHQTSHKLVDELFMVAPVSQTPNLGGNQNSGKLLTQMTSYSQNLVQGQNILKAEIEKLYNDIKQHIQAEQEFVIEGDKKVQVISSHHHNVEDFQDDEKFFNSRQGSLKYNFNNTQNNNPNPRMTFTQHFDPSTIFHSPNFDPNQAIDRLETKLNSLNWVSHLQRGIVTMPLGTNSSYIPLQEMDIGSIFAFVLQSNIYREALIIQNYMDITSKIKGLGKQIRVAQGLATTAAATGQLGGGGPATDPTPTPVNGGSAANTTQPFQSQPMTATGGNDDHVKLMGKNDVFNATLKPHEIEAEMLCGENLVFVVNFSTYKQDFNLRMLKNGSSTLIKNTLQFQTGRTSRRIVGIAQKANEVYDLHYKILPAYPKEFLEHKFFKESVIELDQILLGLNQYFFSQQVVNVSKLNISPGKTPGGQLQMDDTYDLHEHHEEIKEESSFHTLGNEGGAPYINLTPSLARDSKLRNSFNAQGQPVQQQQHPSNERATFCGVQSPASYLNVKNTNDILGAELNIPMIDYELKIYYPKKFEALRRFYCGEQQSFIRSLIETVEWSDVTGGKTKSKFYKSLDEKYVFKEVKKSEFKMFIEFAPQYFDYLCTSFFHNYPCTLCKILGAFKIKIQRHNPKMLVKKYIYVSENLNFGIKPEDEEHIIRYDLKGSSLNRFVKNKDPNVVLHDNNFLWDFKGKPLPIRYQMNRILHICINNDTLCLSKSNIVDYSLLTIIDTKRKKLRFGIIDYVQQYTIDKIFESKFKNFMSGGEVPTIVDPEKYKLRFKRAMRRYFVGMAIQTEKAKNRGKSLKQVEILKDESDEEDEVNETMKIDKADLTMINQSSMKEQEKQGEPLLGALNPKTLSE